MQYFDQLNSFPVMFTLIQVCKFASVVWLAQLLDTLIVERCELEAFKHIICSASLHMNFGALILESE